MKNLKLVVMSDSHGHDEMIEKVMSANRDADYMIHLGDLCSDRHKFPQLIFVRGNCDYDNDMPVTLISEFNGLRFFITHGHKAGSWNREETLAHLASAQDCSIVLYGHTHVPSDNTVDGVRLLNPGSLYYNRDGSELGYLILNISKDGRLKVKRMSV